MIFPDIKFVYMTGHLNGDGIDGNTNQRNEQIRRYCRNNNKILYDFADIESYDPDGNFYLDKMANDNCDYDSDNDGSQDRNWAEDWQNSHLVNVDWYNCSAAHSKALNGNRKAYAAWWLWASLAGWNGIAGAGNSNLISSNRILYQNYPNPFNPTTKISWTTLTESWQTLIIYNVLGDEIATLLNEYKPAGNYNVEFGIMNLPAGQAGLELSSGMYFYRLQAGSYYETKKMILLK